ncbi:mRNA 3'-end-processing protein rna-14 [Striga asiatica]|uniref:mRNA 3'-end-processing protein rna-14 n=1 Tax=Striga asiatica TaxID=4170 RepID=A0A5A7NZ70_STRAF|nr:mRNA 3'-end-processing protein rna-14 [Striga asiatica]
MTSPFVLALTAELTADSMCSRSAPISSAISMQWDATTAAADATAAGVATPCFPAASAATAAATPATETAAWRWALWARISCFFLSRWSFIQRPALFRFMMLLALDSSTAETLHDRAKNSMDSVGVSGCGPTTGPHSATFSSSMFSSPLGLHLGSAPLLSTDTTSNKKERVECELRLRKSPGLKNY